MAEIDYQIGDDIEDPGMNKQDKNMDWGHVLRIVLVVFQLFIGPAVVWSISAFNQQKNRIDTIEERMHRIEINQSINSVTAKEILRRLENIDIKLDRQEDMIDNIRINQKSK